MKKLIIVLLLFLKCISVEAQKARLIWDSYGGDESCSNPWMYSSLENVDVAYRNAFGNYGSNHDFDILVTAANKSISLTLTYGSSETKEIAWWDDYYPYQKPTDLNGCRTFFNCATYCAKWQLFNTSCIFNILSNSSSYCGNDELDGSLYIGYDEYLDNSYWPQGSQFHWKYRLSATSSFLDFLTTTDPEFYINISTIGSLKTALNNTSNSYVDLYLSVEVTDPLGNKWISQPFTASEVIKIYKSPPSITTVTTNTICQGTSNGQATIKFNTDGYTPFRLFYDGGKIAGGGPLTSRTDIIISNLTSGSHNFYTTNLIIDAALPNCASGANTTIPQYSTSFNPQSSVNEDVCSGESIIPKDITVNFGGKKPYSYQLTKNSVPILNFYSCDSTATAYTIHPKSLVGGSYIFTVTDKCPKSNSLTITIPVVAPSLNFPVTQDATCNSPFNGHFSGGFSASNVTGIDHLKITEQTSVTVIYDNNIPLTGLSYQNLLFNPTSSGTYQFKYDYSIRSNHKVCSLFNTPVSLIAPPLPFPASVLSQIDPTCHDSTNGTITAKTANPGFNMYYTLTSFVSPQSGTNFTVNKLAAGWYPLRFCRTVSGCKDVYFLNPVTLTNPPQLIIGYTKTDDCSDEGLGSIHIDSNALQNLIFTLKEPNGTEISKPGTNNPFEGLAKGMYQIYAKQNFGNNCVSPLDTIHIYNGIDLSTTVLDKIRCFGDSVKVINTFEPGMEGSGSYSMLLSETSGAQKSITPGTTFVGKGDYNLVVKDLLSTCAPYTNHFSIPGPDSLLRLSAKAPQNAHGYQITCNKASDGSIQAVAYGGGTERTFSAIPASGDSMVSVDGDFTVLTAGTYRIKVTDDYGCLRDTVLSLTEPPLIVAQVLKSNQVACGGDSSGYLIVGSSGGIAPYAYKADERTLFIPSDTISYLSAGDHLLTVRDAAGCEITFTGEVKALTPAIKAGYTVSTVSCNGARNGRIVVFPLNDSALYQYQWTDFNDIVSPVLEGLAPGNYQVTISDTFGCTKHLNFTITEPQSLYLSGSTYPVCWGEKYGKILADASGGTPPYKYQVDEGKKTDDREIPKLRAGSHTLAVVDANGCTLQQPLSIPEKTVLVTADFLVASEVKLTDTVVFVDISLPKPDSVVWHFDNNIEIVGKSLFSPMVKFPGYGFYEVSMDCYYDGCAYSLSKNVEVSEKGSTITKSHQQTGLKSIKASPNPNNGNFDLEVELYAPETFSLFIHDISGHEFFRWNIPATDLFTSTIHIPAPKPGTYIISAVTNGSHLEKVIIVY